jgi:hypothetical protein
MAEDPDWPDTIFDRDSLLNQVGVDNFGVWQANFASVAAAQPEEKLSWVSVCARSRGTGKSSASCVALDTVPRSGHGNRMPETRAGTAGTS